MTKLVLIGCGEIATLAHLPALSQLQAEGLVVVSGVCDIDPQKAQALAAKHDVPHCGTAWKEVVAKAQADAVSVCLPPGPNAEVSSEALERGLHVLCEKPPGRNLSQAERMAGAASAQPRLVTMVAFNRRFAPLYGKALEHSLRLGPPNVFYGRFTRPGLGTAPSNTATDWITSDGSHALDLALATMGCPRSVSVARQTTGAGPANAWTIHLHAATGSAVLLFNFAAGRRVERFEWAGPGYDVLLELPDTGEWSQQGQPPQRWTAAEVTRSTEFFINYGWLNEYRAFLDAVSGRGPLPRTDFGYAAQFMQVVQTILECAPGEVRGVPRTQPHMVPNPTRDLVVAAETSTRRAPKTGVQVLLTPKAQATFFKVEQLAQVGAACDLRLRTDEDWRSRLPTAEALITGWGGEALTPEDILAAKQLKLVVVIGASVKIVCPEFLLQRNIQVCNTADAIAQSVAEHCLLLSLAGLRRLTEVDRQMHRGLWPPHRQRQSWVALLKTWALRVPGIQTLKPVLKPLVAHRGSPQPSTRWSDLQGQVVGLVGWSHTARHFARLLQPFHCQLLVGSEHLSDLELAAVQGRRASLGEIFGGAGVISIHKGLSERSRGMIGAHLLALLRPGSVLVNTARAGLIEESPLIARLQRRDVVAALDVFHAEPLPKGHPLRQLPNVILSPHNASTTAQCQQRVGQQALEIVLDWLSGKNIPAISPARLANMT